ncbi:hypothetical protein GDO81_030139 [Engystomops pustulosus]|uniref:Uncharacterized protein n=1 Tax=Engystomops pustulosus TaxID=76066 RepID=A0AAV6Z0B6_ENGPU|nr:hypothetical protein GDO81_030139 [Engystomops pustulosus]
MGCMYTGRCPRTNQTTKCKNIKLNQESRPSVYNHLPLSSTPCNAASDSTLPLVLRIQHCRMDPETHQATAPSAGTTRRFRYVTYAGK